MEITGFSFNRWELLMNHNKITLNSYNNKRASTLNIVNNIAYVQANLQRCCIENISKWCVATIRQTLLAKFLTYFNTYIH